MDRGQGSNLEGYFQHRRMKLRLTDGEGWGHLRSGGAHRRYSVRVQMEMMIISLRWFVQFFRGNVVGGGLA